jgi:hypothetical protein
MKDKAWSLFVAAALVLALIQIASVDLNGSTDHGDGIAEIIGEESASAVSPIVAVRGDRLVSNSTKYCGPSKRSGFNRYQYLRTIRVTDKPYDLRIYRMTDFWGKGATRTVQNYCVGNQWTSRR